MNASITDTQPQTRAYLRWLRFAIPAWVAVGALHCLTLYIPLNSDAPGEDMRASIVESASRMWDAVAEAVRQGRLPSWMRLLENGAIVGSEVLFVLGVLASCLVYRWHWAVPITLAGVWGALTSYLVLGYLYFVKAPLLDLPRFFWERLGWGFLAWYGTLLLAALVAGGLEWRRRIELRRTVAEYDRLLDDVS